MSKQTTSQLIEKALKKYRRSHIQDVIKCKRTKLWLKLKYNDFTTAEVKKLKDAKII